MTVQEKPRADRPMPARLAIPLPELAPLRGRDIVLALRDGAADFLKAPEYGLTVAGFAVIVGLCLQFADAYWGVWLFLAALVVPLVAPILLAGFYEISSRRAARETIHTVDIWHYVAAECRGQAMWVGVVLAAISGLWIVAALILWQFTGNWAAAAVIQAIIALPICVTLYGIAAISLPMLHDCRLDALTAMLHSHAMVSDNRFVMLLWAVLAAILIGAAVSTWFIGLLVVVPVLAHAQWHLYRRATI